MLKRGWIVVMAGLGLNLALGVLYAWSMFSKQLTESVANGGFGWTRTAATLPYTCAIGCFALMMVPAGRLQDRLGPRLVATLGAVLCGLGLVVAGFGSESSYLPVVLGFGVLAGMGIGLGYASATPAAVKWFGPEKKGLITGIVVAGFGIAPVYIAPLAKYLLSEYGIQKSFWIFGVLFLGMAVLAAQFLINPKSTPSRPGSSPAGGGAPAAAVDLTLRQIVKTRSFWSLYLQYACCATAGLMLIGHIAKIVSVQSGGVIQAGFVFVAVLAAFNAGGRVVAGLVSDIIGRVSAMVIVFILQALLMFFFDQFETFGDFMVGVALVGFNYGACLSLFPATTADRWGTKGLGLNYGVLFTAWGVGGVFGPMLAGWIADASGTYLRAYQVAGGLLVIAALLAMLSHIQLSFSLQEKTLVIKFGNDKPG